MTIAAGQRPRFVENAILLLLAVFTTEVTVMEFFQPLFREVGRLPAAITDATLLAVFIAIPLGILYSPVILKKTRDNDAMTRPLLGALLSVIAGFSLIELLIMLLLPELLHDPGSMVFGLVDASLTTLLGIPLLRGMLHRFEASCHPENLPDLHESPLLLYLLMLFIVFLAALLHDLVTPTWVSMSLHGPVHIVSAVILTLIIAPFFWLFLVRPLRRALLGERVRGKAVYEQVVDAVLQVDSRGLISALNPAAVRLFDYAESELIGRPVAMLFDCRDTLWQGLSISGGQESNSAGFQEITGWHRSGRSLLLEISVSAIVTGGVKGSLLIVRDIGERRAAEQALLESDIRFREVFDQAEDAIFFFKPDSHYIVDVNTTSEQLFGFRKADLQGRGFERIFKASDLVRVQNVIYYLRPGQVAQIDQLVAKRADDSQCLVSMRVKLMSLQGVNLGYCAMRDVTELVRMERQSREIQARLIQTNKMTSLGLLVSGVAHEINNPNNFILANAELLTAGWEDSLKILREYYRENGDFLLGGIPFSEYDRQSAQLLEGIVDGAQRISRIIASLKYYARPESAEVDKEIDVNRVVSSAIAILQHELVKYTSRFESELPDNLPPVNGNSQQLGQVVINLIMNACQALPERGHGIHLKTYFDTDTDTVNISVRDEGCGIATENGRRIMEPFFTTKLDNGGTGLGLSICQAIVTEHGGSLDFVSLPGQGTTFTVKLPARPESGREFKG